jgi:UTP--glucose-1-phosphate uridylyltransferase
MIKKAIIPAAGLGTRFLPATKAMPKEMLPIINKPTIQYIVEEAVASGIEDIIIVTGKGKRAIEDHFDYHFELEKNLYEKEKFDLLEEVKSVAMLADIHYIRQKEPLGLGHAIWCARKFIGNEPFAVLLGDDIIQGKNLPCLQQLINEYNNVNSSIIGVQQVDWDQTYRYGIVETVNSNDKLSAVKNMVEKPPKGTAQSNLAIMGRYILTPEIFSILDKLDPGAGGEIQLTDAIHKLGKFQDIYAYEYDGKRYDVGEKLGFIETTLEIGLQTSDIKDKLIVIMEKLISEYKVKN